MVSHLINGETGSEKLNNLPKVVWLEVAEVGLNSGLSGSWHYAFLSYHTASVVQGYIAVQLFSWTDIEDLEILILLK